MNQIETYRLTSANRNANIREGARLWYFLDNALAPCEVTTVNDDGVQLTVCDGNHEKWFAELWEDLDKQPVLFSHWFSLGSKRTGFFEIQFTTQGFYGSIIAK